MLFFDPFPNITPVRIAYMRNEYASSNADVYAVSFDLGKMNPDSFSYSSWLLWRKKRLKEELLILSCDLMSADRKYVGLKMTDALRIVGVGKKETFIDILKTMGEVENATFFQKASPFRYVGGDFLFFETSSRNISSEGWVIESTDQGVIWTPYWDIARSQALYEQIPRTATSVRVVVEKKGFERAGVGSSIRAAVASALPQDEPFSSLDITSLRVVTDEAYRIHEVNADVFSDDLAFIRTHLKDLVSLDLSESRFYDDTIPRSAFDSSLNIEYAYNLPKGYLQRLTHITLPNTVKSVDAYAFRKLRALSRIELPHVTHIGAQAFEECVSLDAVVAPKTQRLEQGAFFGCKSLIGKGLKMPKLKSMNVLAFLDSGITSQDAAPLKMIDRW